MLRTVEVRWFGLHPVPNEIRNWFSGYPGEPEHQPLRRDYYLQPIKDSGLSVKLREGGLEIKQRQRRQGHVRLAGSLEGMVERWVKWRFPLHNNTDLLRTTMAEGESWVAIDKQRLLRRYLIDEEGVVGPPISQPTVRADCQLELTSVRYDVHRWWTVGFEADADTKAALDQLLALTGKMPKDRISGHLSIQNSFGYPRWLASLPDS